MTRSAMVNGTISPVATISATAVATPARVVIQVMTVRFRGHASAAPRTTNVTRTAAVIRGGRTCSRTVVSHSNGDMTAAAVNPYTAVVKRFSDATRLDAPSHQAA